MAEFDFDSIDDFIDVVPEQAKEEPLIVYILASGRQKTKKLRLAFQAGPLTEIKGPRFLVRWSPKRRVLRVEAGDRHPYEPFSMGKGKCREIISCPVPAGFSIDGDRCFPEFYVDAVGRAINIEIPELSASQPAMLPAPAIKALPAPVERPAGKYDADLAATLGLTERFPQRFGDIKLTPSESRILEILYRRDRCSRDAAMMATADDAETDERDSRVIDVYVLKLRRKLEPIGIEIETITGVGWRISQKNKRFIAQLIGEAS